jgi:glycosyltransferase involved in cell wall biosynthesis
MTRVVVLTPTYDGRDGLSCLSREFADGLRRAAPASSVAVISLAGSADGTSALVRCGGSRLRFAWRSLRAALRRPAVVVVMHANVLPVAAPFLVAGSRLLGVLVGIEAWRPLDRLHARVLRRASAIVAISSWTARRFADANPALGAAVDVCRPCTPPLAEPAGIPPLDPGYALIVGRLSAEERYKGHDRLIEIWPRVREAVPGARLVVAGTGDDLPRLETRAREAGLDGAVAFLGDVDDRTLAALYRDARLLVLPSPNEGFGLVFLEAMASGCPCVGAPGAAEEIIEPGKTGLIVDPADRDGLVEAVVRLLGDPATARRMGQAGAARASAEFSGERFATDLSRVLARLLTC